MHWAVTLEQQLDTSGPSPPKSSPTHPPLCTFPTTPTQLSIRGAQRFPCSQTLFFLSINFEGVTAVDVVAAVAAAVAAVAAAASVCRCVHFGGNGCWRWLYGILISKNTYFYSICNITSGRRHSGIVFCYFCNCPGTTAPPPPPNPTRCLSDDVLRPIPRAFFQLCIAQCFSFLFPFLFLSFISLLQHLSPGGNCSTV